MTTILRQINAFEYAYTTVYDSFNSLKCILMIFKISFVTCFYQCAFGNNGDWKSWIKQNRFYGYWTEFLLLMGRCR